MSPESKWVVLWTECLWSQHSYVEVLTPTVMVLGGGAFGRCLGPEGGALMKGISALVKRPPESSLACSAMRTVEKTASPEPRPHRHPDLGLPASRTMRNKCLMFKPPSLWYFVIAARTKIPCEIRELEKQIDGGRGLEITSSENQGRGVWWRAESFGGANRTAFLLFPYLL